MDQSENDNKPQDIPEESLDSQLYQDPPPEFTGFAPAEVYEPEPVLKHSGLGIASFIIFISMAVLFIVLVVLSVSLLAEFVNLETGEVSDDFASRLEEMTEMGIIGLGVIASFFGNLIGLILGIIGWAQKNRKKVFAILGTVFNGLVIGGLVLMMVIVFLAAATA